jgi:hypothetical protein
MELGKLEAMFMRIGIVALSFLVGACGDGANPCKDVKPYCDGNVAVNCENWQGIEGTPYEKSMIHWDCNEDGQKSGVEKTCKIGSEMAVCIDTPLVPCSQEETIKQNCDGQGARFDCLETVEGPFRNTMKCSKSIGGVDVFTGTCHLIVYPAGTSKPAYICVDFPKIPCDLKDYPKCETGVKYVNCSGSPSTGYFEDTCYINVTCPW